MTMPARTTAPRLCRLKILSNKFRPCFPQRVQQPADRMADLRREGGPQPGRALFCRVRNGRQRRRLRERLGQRRRLGLGLLSLGLCRRPVRRLGLGWRAHRLAPDHEQASQPENQLPITQLMHEIVLPGSIMVSRRQTFHPVFPRPHRPCEFAKSGKYLATFNVFMRGGTCAPVELLAPWNGRRLNRPLLYLRGRYDELLFPLLHIANRKLVAAPPGLLPWGSPTRLRRMSRRPRAPHPSESFRIAARDVPQLCRHRADSSPPRAVIFP